MTNALQEVSRALDAVGASPWDKRVATDLARHALDESEIIAAYSRFADQPIPAGLRYLVRLIVEDEERHHKVLMDMARSVAWGPVAHQRDDTTPPLPARTEGDASLHSVTQRFLEIERRDRRDLKRLARELAPVHETTLWGLLVDLMLLDTEKHIRILEFIDRSSRHKL